jgi:ATP-binding cassette subfamily B protein
MSFFWNSSWFISALQKLVIVTVGTVLCVNGSLTAGEFVAFIFYNTMLSGPIRQLGRMISEMSKAGVSIDRIAEIMNADEEDYADDESVISGDICFDKVTFEYEQGKPVLSDVSFTIPQGTTLGIIGGTGSGKSTLIALLARLYDTNQGAIYINGTNIKDIPLTTLRRNLGMVLQEGFLYSKTVGQNISFASDSDDMAKIEEAAKSACVDDNIKSFVNGYDTIVGERGVTLSGGQKQRVSIARTLMRHSPILIFDDSLSAVDSVTDAKIRANLKKHFDGATVIIISHRITTIMHADNIIVLEGGKIIESGTNEQLLQQDGEYKKIYDLQMSLPDDLKGEVI